jgi:hypothetical protein
MLTEKETCLEVTCMYNVDEFIPENVSVFTQMGILENKFQQICCTIEVQTSRQRKEVVSRAQAMGTKPT